MQVGYELTEKDLLEGQTKHAGFFHRGAQLSGAFLIAVAVGGLFLPGALRYYHEALLTAGGLLLIFRLRLSAKLAFKRDLASHAKVELTTSESAIRVVEAKGSSDIKWDGLVRFSETKHLFLLYLRTSSFMIVPKRAFAPPELLDFRQMLQLNLGAKTAAFKKRISPAVAAFVAVVVVVIVLLGLIIVRSYE